jgi:hypothetical protein
MLKASPRKLRVKCVTLRCICNHLSHRPRRLRPTLTTRKENSVKLIPFQILIAAKKMCSVPSKL